MLKNRNIMAFKSCLMGVLLLFLLQSFNMAKNSPTGISAGVTIPANQEFVLGEYKHPDYRSTLTNKSAFNVQVELRDRKSNALTNNLELGAGESVKVNVSKDEMVILKNNTDTAILIKVRANRNVSGMRYQELDAYNE